MSSYDMNLHLNETKSIGGFFETEKLTQFTQGTFHSEAIAVTSGRACLKQAILSTKATMIHVPFYICDSVLTVIKEAGVHFRFYSLNEDLSPATLPFLGSNELFLYANYFGLKSGMAEHLKSHYGQQLILDNTQAFFEKGDQTSWSFNSARKFFGVPDGAYVYGPTHIPKPSAKNESLIIEHLSKRSENELEQAYHLYQQNELLVSSDWLDMSNYSKTVLEQVDYNQIQGIRNQNFLCYHQAFASLNQLSLKPTGASPFCYPLWLDTPIDKMYLYEQNIFIPTLWKEVLERVEAGFELEKSWSKKILCLPLDHRYSESDCQRVIETIQKLLKNTRGLQSC